MSDTDPRGLKEDPQAAAGTQVRRISAAQSAKSTDALNTTIPKAEYDPVTKRRYYDTAPVPLKRLMPSPVAQKGSFAFPPDNIREISSGWGDTRSIGYDKHTDTGRRHHGLDYKAPFGETVFATGDGKITFVGFQKKNGRESVPGIKQDPNSGDLYFLQGTTHVTVATAKPNNTIGHGGVIIYLEHGKGDFQGYRSEYMHLSEVLVKEGDPVTEGQPIGHVGTSGGDQGLITSGTHLHFQVSFLNGPSEAQVRPTHLVPNRWPRHEDSTTAPGLVAFAAPLVRQVAGLATSTAIVFGLATSANRGTAVGNQSGADIKQRQSDFNNGIVRRMSQAEQNMYAAQARYNATPPVVTNPMTFNFTTGLWDDGKPV